ncbi:MAG: hypothetical protein A3F41_03005 [Coxiella sp. RIFCSPHIGHO2_12_FULL_44_14]|nr:MAG: hypothetical protein A3F41_03005 [Coxiella sp. RIFCSPHIGHO2_12_FULL_44_14]
MLAHGADINTHYAGSEPPFWVAAQNSNVTIDTFNWLLAHPGLRDDLGRYEKTPLMAMIENNQLEKLQSWLTLKGMELVHQYESTQIEEKLTAMGKNNNEAVIFINSYKQLFYLITINPKTPSSLDVVKKWLLNTGKISAENAEQMGIILKEKYPEKSKDVDLWCDWFSGKSFLDIDTMNKNLFAFTLFAQQCKENTYAFEIIRAIVFNQFKKYFNTYQNKDADQKEILLHAMQSSPLFASYFKPSGVLSGIKIAVFTVADVFPNYSKEFESMEKEIRAKLASSPHPLTNS